MRLSEETKSTAIALRAVGYSPAWIASVLSAPVKAIETVTEGTTPELHMRSVSREGRRRYDVPTFTSDDLSRHLDIDINEIRKWLSVLQVHPDWVPTLREREGRKAGEPNRYEWPKADFDVICALVKRQTDAHIALRGKGGTRATFDHVEAAKLYRTGNFTQQALADKYEVRYAAMNQALRRQGIRFAWGGSRP